MDYHQRPCRHQQQHQYLSQQQCYQLPKQLDYHYQLPPANQSHRSFTNPHKFYCLPLLQTPTDQLHQSKCFFQKYNRQAYHRPVYSFWDQVNRYCYKILESVEDMDKITNSIKMQINKKATKAIKKLRQGLGESK